MQTENLRTGTKTWELAPPARKNEIAAYASAVSVKRGGTINFCVNCPENSASVSYYRMGWYGGAGSRLIAGPTTFTVSNQVRNPIQDARGLYDSNWLPSTTLTVPADPDPSVWPSGIYLAKFTAGASKYQTFAIFVVTDPTRASKYVYQQSTSTYQGYNAYGGLSYYPVAPSKARADAVSFNRPYDRGFGSGDFLNWDIDFVRFAEREGYDLTYTTDLDTHLGGLATASHQGLLIVGHDEYWSKAMRDNVTQFQTSGNVALFASDVCEWQIRFEPDTAGNANRTQVCYKTNYKNDPQYIAGKYSNVATQWRSSVLNLPEQAQFGVGWAANPVNGDMAITNTSTWVTDGSGATAGTTLKGLLGYEVDSLSKDSPSNIQSIANSQYTQGSTSGTSNMTLFTTSSNTFVFATGSMQWCWGLDDYVTLTNSAGALTNPIAQQITRNVLNHM